MCGPGCQLSRRLPTECVVRALRYEHAERLHNAYPRGHKQTEEVCWRVAAVERSHRHYATHEMAPPFLTALLNSMDAFPCVT